jgi:hypothetical protein
MTKLALLAAAVQALLAALVLLDVLHLTDDQIAGIMLAVNAVLAAIASWFEPSIPWGVKNA